MVAFSKKSINWVPKLSVIFGNIFSSSVFIKTFHNSGMTSMVYIIFEAIFTNICMLIKLCFIIIVLTNTAVYLNTLSYFIQLIFFQCLQLRPRPLMRNGRGRLQSSGHLDLEAI